MIELSFGACITMAIASGFIVVFFRRHCLCSGQTVKDGEEE